jgi:predicted O-linked N-acetylglucosamine transferase (SPINDLY family)
MEALRAHQDAVLWLFASHPHVQANLRAAAADHGVAPKRLIFAERLDHDAHIARLRCADLALDTLPIGSHTTGADALWAGVPLLTCRGDRFAGRVGASLVSAAGLPDLLAKDVDEYGARLHALLARPDELREYAAHLERTRASSPLWDTAAYAADFEALLARAYDETMSSRRAA